MLVETLLLGESKIDAGTKLGCEQTDGFDGSCRRVYGVVGGQCFCILLFYRKFEIMWRWTKPVHSSCGAGWLLQYCTSFSRISPSIDSFLVAMTTFNIPAAGKRFCVRTVKDIRFHRGARDVFSGKPVWIFFLDEFRPDAYR
jgi:hypothetical protein